MNAAMAGSSSSNTEGLQVHGEEKSTESPPMVASGNKLHASRAPVLTPSEQQLQAQQDASDEKNDDAPPGCEMEGGGGQAGGDVSADALARAIAGLKVLYGAKMFADAVAAAATDASGDTTTGRTDSGHAAPTTAPARRKESFIGNFVRKSSVVIFGSAFSEEKATGRVPFAAEGTASTSGTGSQSRSHRKSEQSVRKGRRHKSSAPAHKKKNADGHRHKHDDRVNGRSHHSKATKGKSGVQSNTGDSSHTHKDATHGSSARRKHHKSRGHSTRH